MKIRHPEKVNKPVNPIKRKPNWIKSKIINSKEFFNTKSLINKSKLVEFYKKSFQFESGVIENFNWRYRLGFNDYEPIVLIIGDEIMMSLISKN